MSTPAGLNVVTTESSARELDEGQIDGNGQSMGSDFIGDSEMEIFLFCNPSSGGNAAAGLTNMRIMEVCFAEDDISSIPAMRVHIVNLKNSQQRLDGFNRLQARVSQRYSHQENNTLSDSYKIRAIAAGGDGTVKWVIQELRRVKCLHVPIGIIPFGTGNDLSRVLRWGAGAPSPLLGVGLVSLRKILSEFTVATAAPFDVWQVNIKINPENGKYMVLKDGKEVRVDVGSTERMEDMINYFSLGCDAQIVWAFEKHRHKSALQNKIEYGIQGGFQALPMNAPPRLRNLIQKLKMDDHSLGFHDQDRAMIFQNIPSYAGGMNLWGRPQKNRTQAKAQFTPQAFNDGKLELLSVQNPLRLGLQVVSRGAFKGVGRLSQGTSYELEIKPDAGSLYLQTDGEPLKVQGATSVTIETKEQVMILSRLHPVARVKMQRASIESAKELTLQSSSKEEAILYQGVLYIRVSQLLCKTKWRKKFFILHRRSDGRLRLEYYSKVSKVLRGSVKHLGDTSKVMTLPELTAQYHENGKRKPPISWSPNPMTTFAIRAGRKTTWLCAENLREKNSWMEAISAACQ